MEQEKLKKKKILIVEDEPIIGLVCTRVLAKHNFAVDVVENGLVAMKKLENNHYDICLSDVRIPEMNGMELYKYLKESFPLLADNTVFMTGDGVSSDIQLFMEQNNAKCILKPFTPEELDSAIGELSA